MKIRAPPMYVAIEGTMPQSIQSASATKKTLKLCSVLERR